MKKPLTVKVSNGILSITIGIETLAWASDHMPNPMEFKVSNPSTLANDVVTALMDEHEDGSTPVQRMLDEAIAKAYEDGSEGFSETENSDSWKDLYGNDEKP